MVINEASFVSSDRVLQFDGVGRPHLGCYTDWHAEGFNDSFWNSGPGPFGFGYPSQGTNLAAVMQNRFSTVYLRREFSATPGQTASASPLELVIDYDDGFVVYVNGVEVARRNAGPTPAFVFHDQTAFNRKPAAGAETIALGVANARLHEGINVLAIHVLNDAVTQSAGYVGHQPGSGQLRCDASLRIGGGVPEVLVSAADSWRYFVGRHAPSGGLLDPTDFSSGLAPGPEWTQIGYADGTWVVAPGALGFDTAVDYVPQLGTNLLSMRTSRLSVYMRRAFELTAAELDGITSLNLTVDWDDGYVLYLNGQEISRNNLGGAPGAFVGFNQPAVLHNASRDGGGNNPAAIVSVGVTKSQLKVGTNVIAAQLHNNDVGSSDLLLDVQFSATGTTPLTFVTKGSAWRYVIPSSEIASPVPEGAVLKPEFHDWIELKTRVRPRSTSMAGH